MIEERTLRTPRDHPYYGNAGIFVYFESWKARASDPRRVKGEPPSSALFYSLLNQPFNLRLDGLYGCTSLIVISKQGVWISHLFESPSFKNQNNFQRQVLDVLGPGDGTPLMPGLTQFLGPGAAFGPGTQPQAHIITPRKHGDPELLAYNGFVEQIKYHIKNLFYAAGSPLTDSIKITGYTPINPKDNPLAHSSTAKGKVLFQYDPAETVCGGVVPNVIYQFPVWRVWVEDNVYCVLEYSWSAERNQLLTYSQRLGLIPRHLKSSIQTKLSRWEVEAQPSHSLARRGLGMNQDDLANAACAASNAPVANPAEVSKALAAGATFALPNDVGSPTTSLEANLQSASGPEVPLSSVATGLLTQGGRTSSTEPASSTGKVVSSNTLADNIPSLQSTSTGADVSTFTAFGSLATSTSTPSAESITHAPATTLVTSTTKPASGSGSQNNNWNLFSALRALTFEPSHHSTVYATLVTITTTPPPGSPVTTSCPVSDTGSNDHINPFPKTFC